MTDARVLDGITPENIINPPQCTTAQYIASNPAQAVKTTFDNLWDAIGAMTHRMRFWRSLSITSRWALENIHDGVPFRMAGATRACLLRKALIQSNGAITLLGREVVYEARKSDQISRRLVCRRLAEYPDQAAELGLPSGCCIYRVGPYDCGCACHETRRCTSTTTASRVADPTVRAYFDAMSQAATATATPQGGTR